MDKYTLGRQRIDEVLGNVDAIFDPIQKFSPEFAKYIVEVGYGDFYARKGIDDKMREAMAVACLIGQGITGAPLKVHLGAMLRAGWKKEEIVEMLIFLVAFIGFPMTGTALGLLREAIEENTIKPRNGR